MITALYLSNDKALGSKLISWGTRPDGFTIRETPSHVAFSFKLSDNSDEIIIHSTLFGGVHITTREEINLHYRLISEIEIPVTEEDTYRYLEKAKEKIVGKSYDVPAIGYFSYRVIIFKAFRVPFPTKNKFNFKNMYFCVEVYSIITGERYGIVAPVHLMILMFKMNYKVIEGLTWKQLQN